MSAFDGHAPPPLWWNLPILRLVSDLLTMVKIRLKRTGAKNSPVYRVVVADGRSPRDGKFIEELGTYWPLRKDELNFSINLDRAKYWLGVGAQPSETVSSMIRKADKVAVVVPAS